MLGLHGAMVAEGYDLRRPVVTAQRRMPPDHRSLKRRCKANKGSGAPSGLRCPQCLNVGASHL